MCGQFYVDDETYWESQELIGQIAAETFQMREATVRGTQASNYDAKPMSLKEAHTAQFHAESLSKTRTSVLGAESKSLRQTRTSVLEAESESLRQTQASKYQGDVHPTDSAFIIADGRFFGSAASGPVLENVRWGFPSFDRRSLVINARAESAADKRMFQDSLKSRRCVIPARHFYEWDKEKNKATFCLEEGKTLYMAGIFSYFDDEFRFCILTTGANESMIRTHDRMPLILPKPQVFEWLYSEGDTGRILSQGSPLLTKYQEYEQLSLFS